MDMIELYIEFHPFSFLALGEGTDTPIHLFTYTAD